MSILTAIINAILQAAGWLLPVSEAGHSAIFHDFSGRPDGTVWVVTGVVHIGIALGIFAAAFSIFKRMTLEFGTALVDLRHRRLKFRNAPPARKYLYYLMLSFVPMLLWLIPVGKAGTLYHLLRTLSYNKTVLDEGLLLMLTGLLLVLAAQQVTLGRNSKDVTLGTALLAGFSSLVLVPVAGLSLTAGVISLLIIFGVTRKYAVNFALLMSFPVLIVTGIFEIVMASYKAGAVEIILALVISAIAGFLFTRVLKYIVKKNQFRFFGYYDGALGVIAAVTGIVQLIVR